MTLAPPPGNQYRTLQHAGLRVLRSRWSPKRGLHMRPLRVVVVPVVLHPTDQALIVCKVLRAIV